MSKLCLLYGESSKSYSFPNNHSFNRARVERFWELLNETITFDEYGITVLEPSMASEEDILLFHTNEYIQFVKKASENGFGYLDNGDTPVFRGVFEAACNVIGATLEGLDMLMRGRSNIVFNPVGGLHHARKDKAGGFCVFNDPAVAIAKARATYGVKRIFYVDIDAHHGDGVCYDYYNDSEVFTADIHEDGKYLYPGTGSSDQTGLDEAVGTKLNIPLPPGSGDKEFMESFKMIDEHAEKADAKLIIFQCGADGLEGDPLTHLKYSLEAYRFATEKVIKYSESYDDCKLMVLGGGGYNVENVAHAWVKVVKTLLT